MGSIKFNKKNNRSKRVLPGEDHYVGLAFYADLVPAGFGTVDQVTTPEVKAIAPVTITNKGVDGEYAVVYVNDPDFGFILLAQYLKITADNTEAKVATAIAAFINTHTTGYTAVANAAIVSITARPGIGNRLNAVAPYIGVNNPCTLAVTATAFAGGVNPIISQVPGERIKLIADIEAAETLGITADHANAQIKIMHYHINEVFRINPDAILRIGVFAEPAVNAAHTFNELALLRTAAMGKLRKLGVFTRKAFDIGQIGMLQAQYDESFAVFAPCEMYLSANFVGVSLANLPNLAVLTSPNVHLIIAQDGNGTGKALFTAANTYSVGAIGAAIGTVSLAKVHENMGWVEKFNMAVDGGELDIPALANGTLISTLADNYTKDNGLFDTQRLIFLKQFPGYTGTYWNDSHGACPATDDYAYAEDNHAIDKAIRGIYVRMLPKVNGPSLLQKGTGKLAPESIDTLTLEAGKALEEMDKAGELSGYSIYIDPEQDVKATGQIIINIANTSIGVNRHFIINIGY